jgi:hypothetical protein
LSRIIKRRGEKISKNEDRDKREGFKEGVKENVDRGRLR